MGTLQRTSRRVQWSVQVVFQAKVGGVASADKLWRALRDRPNLGKIFPAAAFPGAAADGVLAT